MYTVISTHEYKAVDTDELSFSSGEKIKVYLVLFSKFKQ